MTNIENIIRPKDSPDIDSYIVLELLSKNDDIEKEVNLPICGCDLDTVTHKELEDLLFDYYCENYDTIDTYGFTFSIKDK
jgi:hypothetical protein